MKVALIAPIYTANVIKDIVQENIDEIEVDFVIYDDYTKAVEIVASIQKKYDAIMFVEIGRAHV